MYRLATLITIFFSLPVFAGQSERPLKLVTLEFTPYVSCSSEVPTGSAIDISRMALKTTGHSIVVECLPWKRSLYMVENGYADGIIIGFKTPEREAYGLFPDYPIQYSQYKIFVKKGHRFTFTNLDDLRGKIIGVDVGHSISPQFDRALVEGKFSILEGATSEQNLKKLVSGRIDAYVNNGAVTQYKINILGLSDQIEPLNKPISAPLPSYLWFSKAADIRDKNQFIETLNQTLKRMWSNGTIERITEDYINPLPDRGN